MARYTISTLLVLSVAACGGGQPTDPSSVDRTSGDGGSSGSSSGGSGQQAGGDTPAESAGDGLGSVNPGGRVVDLRLRDADSGAEYDALGRGDDPLTPLPGYNQFWFAWSIFNDGSEIFNRPETVHTGPLEANGECAVPCDEIRPGCPSKDCIPALTRPEQVGAQSEAAAYLSESSFVVGVAIGNDIRAYPHNILWWHEIVNDVVGGVPLALTHCPLTFSSIAHDPTAFISGQTVELGVSGQLFNANLVFYNRADDTWFSQLLGVGTKGASLGKTAPRVHSWEMTWAAWKTLHPETTVLSEQTGHARNYQNYPYGSYFSDHGDDFQQTSPAADPIFPAKALTYGVRVGGAAKAYVHSELAVWAAATSETGGSTLGVVNDTVGTSKIAVVFDLDAGYVQAFDRTGQPDLELVR